MSESMSYEPTRQKSTSTTPTQPFSAKQYREAMGPGYHVATFREQPSLTGRTPTVFPRSAPVRPRVGPLLRSLAASLAQVRFRRRTVVGRGVPGKAVIGHAVSGKSVVGQTVLQRCDDAVRATLATADNSAAARCCAT